MKNILGIVCCLFYLTGCMARQEDLNTLTMWHWMVDRDNAFQELAKEYEEQTGIKVKIELFAPPDAYTQRIIASSQARTLPDVFGILDKKQIFATFIESGFVADLTFDFQKDDAKWKNSLFQKALDVNRFKEGNIYNIMP